MEFQLLVGWSGKDWLTRQHLSSDLKGGILCRRVGKYTYLQCVHSISGSGDHTGCSKESGSTSREEGEVTRG